MTPTFSSAPPSPPRSADEPARVRRAPAGRRIVAAWRALAGDARTLLAVSGGADSTALALAIAAAARRVVVIGHVRHAMRPDAETRADRDAARALAARLGVAFVEARVGRVEGNVEDSARRARRAALTRLAGDTGCAVVATAHTANDQAETALMALMRGAGPRGLAGMPASARWGAGVTLIRPMLGVTRADAERLCRLAGVEWRDDATNRDEARTRAFLRARVSPVLASRWPSGAARASASASLMAGAFGLVEDRAREVFGAGLAWPRETLAREREIVIGEGLRRAWRGLTGGAGADRLGLRRVSRVTAAIVDGRTETRRFDWPGGVELTVGARLVTMRRPSEPS